MAEKHKVSKKRGFWDSKKVDVAWVESCRAISCTILVSIANSENSHLVVNALQSTENHIVTLLLLSGICSGGRNQLQALDLQPESIRSGVVPCDVEVQVTALTILKVRFCPEQLVLFLPYRADYSCTCWVDDACAAPGDIFLRVDVLGGRKV